MWLLNHCSDLDQEADRLLRQAGALSASGVHCRKKLGYTTEFALRRQGLKLFTAIEDLHPSIPENWCADCDDDAFTYYCLTLARSAGLTRRETIVFLHRVRHIPTADTALLLDIPRNTVQSIWHKYVKPRLKFVLENVPCADWYLVYVDSTRRNRKH